MTKITGEIKAKSQWGVLFAWDDAPEGTWVTCDPEALKWAKKGFASVELETRKDKPYITKIFMEKASSSTPANGDERVSFPESPNDAGRPSKDTLIVRQSCLNRAVEIATCTKTADDMLVVTNILKLAEEFEQWVNR